MVEKVDVDFEIRQLVVFSEGRGMMEERREERKVKLEGIGHLLSTIHQNFVNNSRNEISILPHFFR